jgi:hypothetical protein
MNPTLVKLVIDDAQTQMAASHKANLDFITSR